MVKWIGMLGVVLLAVVGGWTAGCTAQKDTLTAQDYTEVQELNARYAQGFDFNDRNGMAWAETFTEDGEFVLGSRVIKGHKALAEHSNNSAAKAGGPGATRHWVGSLLLTPAPGGAEAKSYVILLRPVAADIQPRLIEPSNSPTISSLVYQDDLVKTPEGWRIKRREIVFDRR